MSSDFNPLEGKRAFIYARVSTEDQADSNSSIDTQLKRARRWCDENGILIVGEYSDGGVSGTTHDREGYSDMFGDIVTKRPDYIVVRDPSRVTREGAAETAKLRDVCKVLGVEFHFLEKGRGFAEEGDSEELVDEIESAINNHYAKEAKKKTHETISKNIEEGKHVSRAVTFAFEEDIPLMPAGRILYEDHVHDVKKNGVVEKRTTPATKIRTVQQFFALVDRGGSIELIAEMWGVHRRALSDAVHGHTYCGLPDRMKVGICEKIELPDRFPEYQRRLKVAKDNGIFDKVLFDPYLEAVRRRKGRGTPKTVANTPDGKQSQNSVENPEITDGKQGDFDE